MKREPHDLNAILASVSAHLVYVPADVKISWALESELDNGNHWAQWRWHSNHGHWIGISTRVRFAPYYVVEYLVFHELLHGIFPGCVRRGRPHSKEFSVAEHCWHTREKAERWLDSHA